MTDTEDYKVVLLGLAESGKSTIIKTIRDGKPPEGKPSYTATVNYERSNQTIFGKKLTLFDLGGQTNFLDRFNGELAEFIFSNVKAFIYVCDITKFEELSRAKYYLDLAFTNLDKYSPHALKYIFLHKVDLVREDMIPEITENMKDFLTGDYPREVVYYTTSVFKKELFQIMGEISQKVSDIYSSITPIIDDFKRNNPSLKELKIFSLINDIENSEEQKLVNSVIENSIHYFVTQSGEGNEILENFVMETNKKIYFFDLSNKEQILLFVFDKNIMKENHETLSTINNKILAFKTQLSKIQLITQET